MDDVLKRSALRTAMRERGFKHVGSGMGSMVYQKPGSNEVLKLFTTSSSYTNFLNIIANNPNKHFPKIIGHEKLSQYKGWHIIKMETLQKLSKIEYEDKYNWLIRAVYYYRRGSWNENLDQKAIKTYESNMNQYPSLTKACQILGENTKIKKWVLDISFSNVMQRNNGDVVITDPFV